MVFLIVDVKWLVGGLITSKINLTEEITGYVFDDNESVISCIDLVPILRGSYQENLISHPLVALSLNNQLFIMV